MSKNDEVFKDALNEIESNSEIEYDKNEKLDEIEEPKKITSLGKASISKTTDTMANESGWKLVALNTLPSQGLLYHDNVEILIKSAKTKEIRHWSTIDEYDPIDVSDKIAFITDSCCRLNAKGVMKNLNSNDILEIDKYQILFKIHRLTFPNSENTLKANIKCSNKKCGKVNSVPVSDTNLKGFDFPEELMEWYSQEEKCFVINSEKLMDTFRIYLPTIGTAKIMNEYKALCKRRGIDEDKAFNKIAPYMIPNWRDFGASDLIELKSQASRWHENKFIFLHKACEMLEKNSKNKVLGICEKCSAKMASSIFLGGSFTAKDIFIVSTRLRDLI
jgi:hypothetical protein